VVYTFVALPKKLIFYGEELLTSANPQAGGPPLVGCPRLVIQYIRRYPPRLESVLSIRNLRTRHATVTRDPFNMIMYTYIGYIFIKKVKKKVKLSL
jgi:hypothetical protein